MGEHEADRDTENGSPAAVSTEQSLDAATVTSPPPALSQDITFKVIPGGFEIWYSERISSEYQELVDQSADFLEDEMGVLNLGLVDHQVLMADGPLSDEVKVGLEAWWAERVEDLDLSES
jgi:hypothetical protein